MKDWKDWLALLFFICVGLMMAALFISALLADYKAGRWEQTKNDRNIIDKDVAQEGLYGCGFIGLFAALIIGVKFGLSYPVAILLGLGVGLIICLCLAFVLYVIQRILIFIVERFFIPRM